MDSLLQRRISAEDPSSGTAKYAQSPGRLRGRPPIRYFHQRGGERGGLACRPAAHFIRQVFPFTMNRRVEELAERIKEQDAGQDAREYLELGVVVLQMHELVSDDGLDLVLLEKLQKPSGNENSAPPSTDGHGDCVVRFHDTDSNQWHSLELPHEVHVLLKPRLPQVCGARRELPDYGVVAVAPDQEGDDGRRRQAAHHRSENRQGHAVPSVRDRPRL